MYFVSSRRDQTLEISSTGGLEDVVFFNFSNKSYKSLQF